MRLHLAVALLLFPFLLRPVSAEEPQPGFEVLVLGTYHAPGMFLADRYTPGHIRATLEKAAPDVVAVECHPDWFRAGRYHVVTYEAEGVAVPWARGEGLPVHGVDWKDIEAWDRMEEASALSAAAPLRRFRDAEELPHSSFFGILPDIALASARKRLDALRDVDWEHLNGVHDDSWARSRFATKSPEQEDFIGRRDRGIAGNCQDVMREHPDRRLVVVVGAHHKPFLDVAFGRMPGVKVLRLGKDVPLPSADEIEAAWTSDDLVNALGHRLDAGSAAFHSELVDLPGARRLLERLRRRGDRPDAARYFEGRIAVHAGRPRTAERLFERLLRRPSEETLYPFPLRQWRMRFNLAEAAQVELARLKIDRGLEKAARELLEPVLAAFESRLDALDRRPREVRRVQCVRDPGFEAGERAASFFDGWATFLPVGGGMLRFDGDDSRRTEGDRSLRIEVTEGKTRAWPFAVRQEVSVPLCREDHSRVTFALSARGEGVKALTLTADPFYASTDRTPLATATIALSPDRWTTAAVTFGLPPGRKFALRVSFQGEKGARLWLDAGTALPASYETVPDEWSRVATACMYLRWLIAGRPEPVADGPGGEVGIRDPGFESGRLAANPLAGWFCADATSGVARMVVDEEAPREGKRAYRFEVLAAKAGAPVNVSQSGALPPGEELELALSLRSVDLSWVRVSVGVWKDDETFEELGDHVEPVGRGRWSRAVIPFRPPENAARFGVFVLFPAEVGGRLTLDAASLKVVR